MEWFSSYKRLVKKLYCRWAEREGEGVRFNRESLLSWRNSNCSSTSPFFLCPFAGIANFRFFFFHSLSFCSIFLFLRFLHFYLCTPLCVSLRLISPACSNVLLILFSFSAYSVARILLRNDEVQLFFSSFYLQCASQGFTTPIDSRTSPFRKLTPTFFQHDFLASTTPFSRSFSLVLSRPAANPPAFLSCFFLSLIFF